MGSLIETMLIESSARDIYLRVKQRSIELGLPCNAGDHIVGFGKFDDFYMYWINVKDGEFLFTARKHYAKQKAATILFGCCFPMIMKVKFWIASMTYISL